MAEIPITYIPVTYKCFGCGSKVEKYGYSANSEERVNGHTK